MGLPDFQFPYVTAKIVGDTSAFLDVILRPNYVILVSVCVKHMKSGFESNISFNLISKHL